MIALVRRTQTTRRTVSRNDRIGQTDTDNWSNPIMTFRKGGFKSKVISAEEAVDSHWWSLRLCIARSVCAFCNDRRSRPYC